MSIWPVLSRQHSFLRPSGFEHLNLDLKVGCRPPSWVTDAASFFFFCRTSLFKGCSALYCLLLVVTCVSFLSSEVVTNSVPLHYFEVTTSYPPTIETYHIDSEGFHVHDDWLLGSGYSSAVGAQACHFENWKVVGSNPTDCWTFFYFKFPFRLSLIRSSRRNIYTNERWNM